MMVGRLQCAIDFDHIEMAHLKREMATTATTHAHYLSHSISIDFSRQKKRQFKTFSQQNKINLTNSKRLCKVLMN